MSPWQERALDTSEAQWREAQRRREEAERQQEAQRQHEAEQQRRQQEQWRQRTEQRRERLSAHLRQWLRDTLGVTCEVSGDEAVVDGVRFRAKESGNTVQVVMVGQCPHSRCREAVESPPLRDLADVGQLLREFKVDHWFCKGRPMTAAELAWCRDHPSGGWEGPWG